MSSNIASRRKLFEKFSGQLHLLSEKGLIDIELKYPKTYICPLCLNQFGEEHLENKGHGNYLTEEDAPPAALGGHRLALTCHQCNSTAGHQIDNHLVHAIRHKDDNSFAFGTRISGTIEYEGKRIQTEITSKGDGLLELLHNTKNNDPSLLDKFIYGLKTKAIGPLLNLDFKRPKVDSQRVNRSLLKTTHIITFSKFGYIFLLDDFYNDVRSEITNMNFDPHGQIFVPDQISEERDGTYYVHNEGAKSILNVFTLKTDYSTTTLGSIYPLPNITPEQIQASLTGRGEKVEAGYAVVLDTTSYDPNSDLFSDIKEIEKVFAWAYS